MQKRRVGSLLVSVVGLGCSNFGRSLDAVQSAEIVHAAIDHGVTFFDTANVYGGGRSEEYLGAALARRRDQVVIGSKFGRVRSADGAERIDASRAQVFKAVEATLRKLRTDYLDLYLLHIPDPAVPIEETLGAMNELIDEGKVREIGCSQVGTSFLRDAAKAAEINGLRPFVNVQNRFNILEGELEEQLGVLDECASDGLAYVPFSPLASGFLSGKYRRGEPPPAGSRLGGRPTAGYSSWDSLLSDHGFDAIERLTSFAEQSGHSLLELAFAALLARPQIVSVISGANSLGQLAVNLQCADWMLDPDELKEVERLVGAA